jgi:hypothetical protein
MCGEAAKLTLPDAFGKSPHTTHPSSRAFIVGGLPKLGAQLVILHRVGNYQDELWLAGGLGVDGIELRPGLTDEDQFATDFNIKVRHYVVRRAIDIRRETA